MSVVNKRTGQVEEFSTFEHYMDRYVYLHYETFAEEFQVN